MSGKLTEILAEPHPAFGLHQSAPPRLRGGVGGGVFRDL